MKSNHLARLAALWLVATMGASAATAIKAAPPTVTLTRVPQNGVQPQTAVDTNGTVHLVFLAGKERASDVYYATRRTADREFSKPVRVNHQAGGAVAAGTIRGAQLALGGDGGVHVLWNGSRSPDGGHEHTPLWYSRREPGGRFEPERNLMTRTRMLDGGGSIAADARGNVYAVWHAAPAAEPPGKGGGESARGVYVAASGDGGRTFAREERISSLPGTCGCCGLKSFTDTDGRLHTLYRGASTLTQRDMLHLIGTRPGESATANVSAWRIGTCPMSSAAFVQTPSGVVGAWETENRVSFARLGTGGKAAPKPVSMPGAARQRHPALATNAGGWVLVVWSENTGWQRGGEVAWQVFDKDGAAGPSGRKPGVPVWGFAAAHALPQGGFEILY